MSMCWGQRLAEQIPFWMVARRDMKACNDRIRAGRGVSLSLPVFILQTGNKSGGDAQDGFPRQIAPFGIRIPH